MLSLRVTRLFPEPGTVVAIMPSQRKEGWCQAEGGANEHEAPKGSKCCHSVPARSYGGVRGKGQYLVPHSNTRRPHEILSLSVHYR
jgi:hypothetical protein